MIPARWQHLPANRACVTVGRLRWAWLRFGECKSQTNNGKKLNETDTYTNREIERERERERRNTGLEIAVLITHTRARAHTQNRKIVSANSDETGNSTRGCCVSDTTCTRQLFTRVTTITRPALYRQVGHGLVLARGLPSTHDTTPVPAKYRLDVVERTHALNLFAD